MKSARRRKGAKLGQHFLTGLWAAHRLAEAVAVQPGETILEIGPGKGALTKELFATGAHIVAVEKDPALVRELRGTFKHELASQQFELVEKDIRDFKPESWNLKAESYVLAANIPYYITGEIIRQFLETPKQPRAMALLIQKEVADRIVARPAGGVAGKGKESILSLSVKAYGVPKIIAKVSRGNFSPPPSVDSAILLIEGISKKFFSDVSEEAFFKVVKAGFASKRKFLANNLGVRFQVSGVRDALRECGLDEKIRAEDLKVDDWRCLSKSLKPSP